MENQRTSRTSKSEGVLIIPAGTQHSVCSNEEPRLSLTLNMSG